MKAAFPFDIHTAKATYEIQFGNLERPTYANTSWDTAKFEVCGHKWADLSEGDYGVSVLNDCKYGWSVQGGTLKLTLLKCATDPNPHADKGSMCLPIPYCPRRRLPPGEHSEGGVFSTSLLECRPVAAQKGTCLQNTAWLPVKTRILYWKPSNRQRMGRDYPQPVTTLTTARPRCDPMRL